MRIGIISSGTAGDRIPPTYGGGIQKYAWLLGKELSKRGHEVHIFASQQPHQPSSEIIETVYIHRISRRLKVGNLSTVIFGFKAFLKILQVQKTRGRFHLLHAQSRVSGLIIRTLFPYYIPLVFTAHNWDVALTGSGAKISSLPYAMLFFIEKLVHKKSDHIVSLTKSFQKILLSRYKIPRSKISVIPIMIDPLQKPKDPMKIDPLIEKITSKLYLLFIGRLETEKGLDKLFQIFKNLAEEKENVKLVVVGGGTQELELKRKVIKLNLEERIFILGKLHESQVKFLLKSARALILPSQFEIMPTVILEAWAAECPVIVNKFFGVHMLIRHNETGLLFHWHKSPELISLLLKVLTDEELRNKLIKNSTDQLRANFLTAVVVDKVVVMYKNLLNRWNQ